MTFQFLESGIQWLGGILTYAALALVLYGVWRGTQRQTGRTVGLGGNWLRSWWFYIASSLFFFYIAWLGWVPLKLTVSPQVRFWMLLIGALLFFSGMAFVIWARLALGKNYFVSTGFGAQLFAGHHLVTSGPFAIVRHPMYIGLIVASLGALLIYMTWTTVYFAVFAPFTLIRARREEQALSAEFGEQWQDYCRRVPAFIPWIRQ